MAENKKDSFTFSDKIKNSKPAFNPFSKRVPSKIGANGKPKKTLFERTKRDAPFFVAAAAALLMLPFLYKYSGNIDDGGVLVPPGSEDTIFDPERFGFDPSVEDPTGQIAQYTGRDSFDLIKGWGSAEDEIPAEDDAEVTDWRVQDGLDDNYSPAPSRPSSSPRSYAPAATRAAFQRTPTKINELGSASMNLRGGGGAPFRFGGANLKAAAREDSSGGPRQGVKPVSLQPLRAADTPTRSYFGQGGAAQARASRDALGKSNALQALADAMFNPVRSGGISGGGLGSGEFGAAGGGGQITHTLDYKGITPWWWDMMKERSQKAWEWKYFLWRRNLVEPLVRALADFAVGFGCCLVSGSDDCSMGNFLGVREGYGEPAECAGLEEDEWTAAYPSIPFSKDQCRAYFSYGIDKDVQDPWKEGKKGGQNLGFVGARIDCLSNGLLAGFSSGANVPVQLTDRFNCQALDTTHNFSLQVGGKAKKWHKYHAIVAKNYVPFDNDGTHYLCGGGDRNVNRQSAAAVDSIPLAKVSEGAAQTASKKTQGVGDKGLYNEGLLRDEVNDSCVIYVAEGGILDWDNFKYKTMSMLEELGLKDKNGNEVSGEDAFAALHLYFVEGYAFKQKMSKGANVTKAVNHKGKSVKVRGMPVDELPLKYVDFEEYYVMHRGNTSKNKDSFKDKDRVFAQSSAKAGVDGKQRDTNLSRSSKSNAVRGYCAFSTFRIDAKPIEMPSVFYADLMFDPSVHGPTAGAIKVTLDVPEAGLFGLEVKQSMLSTEKSKTSAVASYDFFADDAQMTALLDAARKGMITARWRATFKNKVSIDEETYSEGDVVPVLPAPPLKCTPGETQTQMNALNCEERRVCQEDGTWTAWEQTDPNCGGANPSVTVSFLDRIPWIPLTDKLNPDIRLRKGDYTGDKEYSNCAPLEEIEKKRLLALDEDTKALLAKAKQMYDQANAENNSTLEYSLYSDDGSVAVTVANLVDAMSIVQDQVPVNAVCMLGKTIGASSRDGNTGLNNMFGSFAAFIGPDSSFFPTLRVAKDGQDIIDKRFHGCGAGAPAGNKQYHYGHYNWNWIKLGDQATNSKAPQDDRKPFEAVLNNGMWKGFPLQAIAEQVNFQRATQWQSSWGKIDPNESMDRFNRNAYHKAYEKVFQGDTSCGLSGTMNYAEVKAYISSLCQNGADNMKPHNGSSLACGSNYKADPTVYTAR